MIHLGFPDDKSLGEGYSQYEWISEACIKGIEWCKKNNLNYSISKKNWTNNEEIYSATEYILSIKKEILKYTAAALNEYSNVDFSEDEWDLFIGRWIFVYVRTIYDIYLTIQRLEDTDQVYEADMYCGNKESIPLDYAEFHDLITYSDSYMHYIWSRVLSHMSINDHLMINFNRIFTKENTVGHFKNEKDIKTKIYKKIVRAIKIILNKEDKVVFNNCYFPKNFLFDLMLSSNFKVMDYINNWYTVERPLLSCKIDLSWRKKVIVTEVIEDSFLKLAIRLEKEFLPITFVEGFSHLMNRSKQEYKFAFNANAIFFSCLQGHIDEVFKVYLMQVKKNRPVFCDVQHGGNYGIDETEGFNEEINSCDVFYSWGWKPYGTNYDKKVIPMPVAKLLGKKSELIENNKTGKFLYINYIFPRFTTDLSLKTVGYYGFMNDEIKFFASLDTNIIKKLIVRLYYDDYGWDYKSILEKHNLAIRFDSCHNFYDSLKQADLVILSDWSTTVLEALYIGKPIIVLRHYHYSNDTLEYAKDDMELLKDVGILVTSWEELRNSIYSIYDDINSWWNEEKRKAAVKKLRNKYIYSPGNSKELWKKEIMKYTKNKNNGPV